MVDECSFHKGTPGGEFCLQKCFGKVFRKQNAGFAVVYPAMHEHLDDFLTKDQLKDRLNLPSTRMVDEMMKKRMIPFQKLGHRTIRFNWEKVKASLEKFEHKAVGQK